MAAAALIHELGHYGVLRCLGKKVRLFRIGITGALLEAGELTPGQELLCALAGPLSGLLPLFAAQWFPKVALCALVQSVFNLLPVYPLDGGRCMSCVMRLLGISEKWSLLFGRLVLVGLGVLSVYATVVLRLGMVPVLMVVILFLKSKGKIPCKQLRHSI